MKKILLLIGSLDIGGTEKQLVAKVLALKDKFDFEVFTIMHKGKLSKILENSGIKIHEPFFKNKSNVINKVIFYISLLIQIFLKVLFSKSKVVHFYLPHAYILGGIATSIFFWKKLVMSRRSMNYYQNNISFARKIEYILHKRVNLIIANSKAIEKQLIREENVPKEKIKLIYNGIRTKKKFTKKKKTKLKFICIANFFYYKNHSFLIDACSFLPKNLNWTLKLVGKDSENIVKELKNEVQKKSLQNKIFFFPQSENIEKYLQDADIGFLFSKQEGLSNSIIEYMNNSLPVIASDIEGNRELISNDRNGFLIKSNDTKDFVKKVLMLSQNESKRIEMGTMGNKYIEKKFNYNMWKAHYYKLYNELLDD